MATWVAVPVLSVLLLSGCDRSEGVNSGDIGLTSSAGTIVVQCIDNTFAKITGFQAGPGYVGRIVVEGPSKEASLIFESGSATDLVIAVRCIDGQPRLEEFVDEDESIITSIGSA